MFNGGIPSLKNLSMKVLAVDIQKGEHDSVSVQPVIFDTYKLNVFTVGTARFVGRSLHAQKTYDVR